MSIMTFGSMKEQQECHLAQIGIQLKDGGRFEIPIFAVPVICDRLAATPIQFCIKNYSHLEELNITDMAQDGGSTMATEVLIGSDFYWQLVSGRLIRGEGGPVTLQTRLGWVLTGQISSVEQHKTATMMTFALQTSAKNNNKELERRLRAFWDLESLGVLDQYLETGDTKRLRSQLRRLQRDPKLLREYDGIIQGQLKNGIMEQVPEPEIDKETTKVRIVYDASAKSEGASPKEFLRIALIADIKKAFLMVSIDPKDWDVLHFIWYDKIGSKEPEIKVFRFRRVVFGVASSPFLLNATVRNHMEGCEELFPSAVAKLMRSMYVDDMSFEGMMHLQEPLCYADSKIALYWIYGLDRDWKPFIQNCTEEIRKLIPPTRWKHYPGRDNPSDLPSRGIMLELKNNTESFNGPNWLSESEIESHTTMTEMPDECAIELRVHGHKQTLSLLTTNRYSLSHIIDIKKNSSLNKPL
uniref:Uncharacterized protein n=1 Tax=Amphimedon queenslandica TaxID=400682 RepID=A0A1X7VL84_AMPQE